MKIIGIIENNPITGVKYGIVETDDNIVDLAKQRAQSRYMEIMQKKNLTIRAKANNTKHK